MEACEVTEEFPEASRRGEARRVKAGDLRMRDAHTKAHELLEVFLHGPGILKQEADLAFAKNQTSKMHNKVKCEEENASGTSQPQEAPCSSSDSEILQGDPPIMNTRHSAEWQQPDEGWQPHL